MINENLDKENLKQRFCEILDASGCYKKEINNLSEGDIIIAGPFPLENTKSYPYYFPCYLAGVYVKDDEDNMILTIGSESFQGKEFGNIKLATELDIYKIGSLPDFKNISTNKKLIEATIDCLHINLVNDYVFVRSIKHDKYDQHHVKIFVHQGRVKIGFYPYESSIMYGIRKIYLTSGM